MNNCNNDAGFVLDSAPRLTKEDIIKIEVKEDLQACDYVRGDRPASATGDNIVYSRTAVVDVDDCASEGQACTDTGVATITASEELTPIDISYVINTNDLTAGEGVLKLPISFTGTTDQPITVKVFEVGDSANANNYTSTLTNPSEVTLLTLDLLNADSEEGTGLNLASKNITIQITATPTADGNTVRIGRIKLYDRFNLVKNTKIIGNCADSIENETTVETIDNICDEARLDDQSFTSEITITANKWSTNSSMAFAGYRKINSKTSVGLTASTTQTVVAYTDPKGNEYGAVTISNVYGDCPIFFVQNTTCDTNPFEQLETKEGTLLENGQFIVTSLGNGQFRLVVSADLIGDSLNVLYDKVGEVVRSGEITNRLRKIRADVVIQREIDANHVEVRRLKNVLMTTLPGTITGGSDTADALAFVFTVAGELGSMIEIDIVEK